MGTNRGNDDEANVPMQESAQRGTNEPRDNDNQHLQPDPASIAYEWGDSEGKSNCYESIMGHDSNNGDMYQHNDATNGNLTTGYMATSGCRKERFPGLRCECAYCDMGSTMPGAAGGTTESATAVSSTANTEEKSAPAHSLDRIDVSKVMDNPDLCLIKTWSGENRTPADFAEKDIKTGAEQSGARTKNTNNGDRTNEGYNAPSDGIITRPHKLARLKVVKVGHDAEVPSAEIWGCETGLPSASTISGRINNNVRKIIPTKMR